MPAIMVSAGPPTNEKSSTLMADKRGEVAGLRVERARGIQGIPPSGKLSQNPKVTS